MDSLKSSSTVERAKVKFQSTVPAQPKAAAPTQQPAKAEPAKSEFVPEKKQQKVTLDPTVGQKAVTSFSDVAKTLPATVSASSLQSTGGKSADWLFTTTASSSTSEAAPAGATRSASTQTKVDEDAERIAREQQKSGAAAAVRTMESALEQRKNEPDFEEYRRQLLIAAEPTIKELGKQLQRQQGKKEQEYIDAFNSVCRISKAAGPEATQGSARALAAGMNDNATLYEPGSPQSEALRQAFEKGEGGVEFATALTKELAAAGKSVTAERVGQTVLGHVDFLRDDFNQKTEHVEGLNRKLQRVLHDAGPGLTAEQRDTIAAEFKAKYANDYKIWEDAAARLEPYLASPDIYSQLKDDPKVPAAVRESAEAGIKGLAEVTDKLANTKAGAAWIAREMMKDAKGEKTLLAQLGDYAKDRKDLADKFALALGKGAATAAMEGAAAGFDTAWAMKGLEKYSHFFGMSQEGMSQVTELFGQFKPGMTDQQVRDLSLELNTKLTAVESGTPPFGADGVPGQVLRGIGIAFAAASLTGDFQQFPEASLSKQIKTIGDLISAGSDAVALCMEVMGKAERIIKYVELGGPAGQAISGIAEGFTAMEAFSKGEKGKALEAGLMSAGNLLLAAGALQGFPVAGQFAGAALTAAAIVVKLVNEKQDKEEMNELKQELFGKVFEQDPALQKAFLGADRQQLQKLLGMGFTPEQIQEFAGTYPSMVGEHGGAGWDGLQRLQRDFNMSTSELQGFLREVGGGNDDTLLYFIQQMDAHTGLGVSRSREEWLRTFEDLSGGDLKDFSAAYGRAAQYLSTRPDAVD